MASLQQGEKPRLYFLFWFGGVSKRAFLFPKGLFLVGGNKEGSLFYYGLHLVNPTTFLYFTPYTIVGRPQ